MHEHLQLVLRSIQDLDQRRVCQRVLVRSALDPHRVLLKTAVDPPEPDQDLNHRPKENVLQLKGRLKTFRSTDVGFVSELQDLTRQILELRLDAAWSQAPPTSAESPAPDSRPSSGFFDFSDRASHSDSLFSLSSAFDNEATPTSPITPLTAADAPPPVSDVNHKAPLYSSALPMAPPTLSHLDSFIWSLLQRRAQTKTFKQILIQTSLSHRTGPLTTGPLTTPTGHLTTPTGHLATPTGPKAPPTASTAAEQSEERHIFDENSCENTLNRRKTCPDSTEPSPDVSKNLRSLIWDRSEQSLKVKGARAVEEVKSSRSRRNLRRKGLSSSNTLLDTCGEDFLTQVGPSGERTGRGGAKRKQQLVRIKASRNLKRRILHQKTATFTLLTTI